MKFKEGTIKYTKVKYPKPFSDGHPEATREETKYINGGKVIQATSISQEPRDPDMPRFEPIVRGGRLQNKITGELSTHEEYVEAVKKRNQKIRDEYGLIPEYTSKDGSQRGWIVNKITGQRIPDYEFNKRKWEEYKKKKKK